MTKRYHFRYIKKVPLIIPFSDITSLKVRVKSRVKRCMVWRKTKFLASYEFGSLKVEGHALTIGK